MQLQSPYRVSLEGVGFRLLRQVRKTVVRLGMTMLLDSLQDGALLLLLLSCKESCACCVLEDFPDTFVGLGRALEVLLCTNLLADVLSLVVVLAWWVYVLLLREKLTCSGVTGFCEVLCSSSIVFWSYLRSFLQPTRMIGRPWQKCRTSEIHYNGTANQHTRSLCEARGHQHTFSCTLSSESGESTAKQMRMTCESGYDRGRRRS